MPGQDTRAALAAVSATVIKAYNNWDLDAIMAFRAPDCMHTLLPTSMGRPPMDNEAAKAWLQPVMPLFRNMKLDVKSETFDEEKLQVVIWFTSSAETDIGPYENEYMIQLEVALGDPEGEGKVKKLHEFVDSKYTSEYFGRLRAAGEGKA